MCQECAKKVLEILEQMEEGGEFDGLNDDNKEVQRQVMGLRLRADMKCPEANQVDRQPKTFEIDKHDIARLLTDKGSFKCYVVGEQLFVRGEGPAAPVWTLSVESKEDGFMISKRPIKPNN